MLFTCSNSGIETLGQVIKSVQSSYCEFWTEFKRCFDASVVDCEQVNTARMSWIVEWNVFQNRTQECLETAFKVIAKAPKEQFIKHFGYYVLINGEA